MLPVEDSIFKNFCKKNFKKFWKILELVAKEINGKNYIKKSAEMGKIKEKSDENGENRR